MDINEMRNNIKEKIDNIITKLKALEDKTFTNQDPEFYVGVSNMMAQQFGVLDTSLSLYLAFNGKNLDNGEIVNNAVAEDLTIPPQMGIWEGIHGTNGGEGTLRRTNNIESLWNDFDEPAIKPEFPKYGASMWDSSIDNLPKPERIVFGIGIGAECFYKTVAEAFVERLYNFESDLSRARSEDDKQRILADRQQFLSSYKEELLSNEDVTDMLDSALVYSRQQEDEHINDAINTEARHNADKGFISILGREYVDDFRREIAGRYTEVSKLIDVILEKEDEFLR